MVRRYLAVVPVNAQGLAEENMGVELSPNIREYLISPEEFHRFCDSGTMDRINAACGILLDEYEDDTIPAGMLTEALDIVRRSGVQLDTVTAALEYALRCGTCVSLYL